MVIMESFGQLNSNAIKRDLVDILFQGLVSIYNFRNWIAEFRNTSFETWNYYTNRYDKVKIQPRRVDRWLVWFNYICSFGFIDISYYHCLWMFPSFKNKSCWSIFKVINLLQIILFCTFNFECLERSRWLITWKYYQPICMTLSSP